MIVGQQRLKDKMNKLTLGNIPRSILLCGEIGSGRHTIVYDISKRLNLDVLDITNRIDLDTIEYAIVGVEPHIYLVDTKNTTEKEQNTLLKFIEEPPGSAYIMLLSTNKDGLLQTIQNRCVVWTMDPYSEEELHQFYGDCDAKKKEIVESIARTPGQVILYQQHPVVDMKTLSKTILNNIARATLPNTLTLIDRLSFKGEKQKFDPEIFFKVFLLETKNEFITGNINGNAVDLSIKLLDAVTKYPNANKEHLFGKFLIELRSCMRGT